VLGVGGAEGLDVQRRDPFVRLVFEIAHNRAAFNIKVVIVAVEVGDVVYCIFKIFGVCRLGAHGLGFTEQGAIR